jgi:hypothetical protein
MGVKCKHINTATGVGRWSGGEKTTAKNCKNYLQKIPFTLKITSSRKIRHVIFINYRNVVYMQNTPPVLPTK